LFKLMLGYTCSQPGSTKRTEAVVNKAPATRRFGIAMRMEQSAHIRALYPRESAPTLLIRRGKADPSRSLP
jgi:hypothetical protein